MIIKLNDIFEKLIDFFYYNLRLISKNKTQKN